jgi:hypothetical protein
MQRGHSSNGDRDEDDDEDVSYDVTNSVRVVEQSVVWLLLLLLCGVMCGMSPLRLVVGMGVVSNRVTVIASFIHRHLLPRLLSLVSPFFARLAPLTTTPLTLFAHPTKGWTGAAAVVLGRDQRTHTKMLIEAQYEFRLSVLEIRSVTQTSLVADPPLWSLIDLVVRARALPTHRCYPFAGTEWQVKPDIDG